MATATIATVIPLQSHPAWAAAERREQERYEAMRRHPSFQSRLREAVLGEAGGSGIPNDVRGLRVLRGGADTECPARNHVR
jgi:hypothetical protein